MSTVLFHIIINNTFYFIKIFNILTKTSSENKNKLMFVNSKLVINKL